MGWLRLAAAMIAAAAFSQTAFAQPDNRKCADAEFDSHSATLDEIAPFAGATHKSGIYYYVDGPNCRIITFYRLPEKPLGFGGTPAERRRAGGGYKGKTAPPFFAVRYVDDSRTNTYKPQWTDQDRCPALVPALEKLEPILAPKLTGPGPYRGMVEGVSDQPMLRFWLTGPVYPQADPDYTLDISMEGGSGAPFGAWLNETFKALEPCWKPDPPVLP